MKNIFVGTRQGAVVEVTVNGEPLDPRFELRNHSPTGFEWGYAGSGPSQLALAILAHHLEDSERALNLYQAFKFAVVAQFPRQGWKLTSDDIDSALLPLIKEKEIG